MKKFKQLKKKEKITEIDEKAFNEKINESNVLCLIYPERPYSNTAVVQTGFNYDIKEETAKLFVPQISDTLLSSSLKNMVSKDFVVAVYGKFIEDIGNYTALCSKPVFHNLPNTLSEDGWVQEIEKFCETYLEEYRLGI